MKFSDLTPATQLKVWKKWEKLGVSLFTPEQFERFSRFADSKYLWTKEGKILSPIS